MSLKKSGLFLTAKKPSRPTSDPWTIRQLLQWTTDFFANAGITTPRLDAEVLLAHSLQQDRLSLYLNYEERVGEDDRRTYRNLIQRRRNFEPVGYLTGNREFFSIPFHVNPSVLIPRPETEHLIESALEFSKKIPPEQKRDPLRILDIGTGCGNIPIALAKHVPNAWIVSVDISSKALAVAKKNLVAHADLGDRISFVHGDLLTWLQPENTFFDIIISNPPYISSSEWEELPRDVREYEPDLALLAGLQGVEIQEKIVETAAPLLKNNGLLIMELGENQDKELSEKAEKQGCYHAIRVEPDYAGKPRVLIAKKTER